VPLEDKQTLVDGVFHSVAKRYDLMNDLMSRACIAPGKMRW
jgi:demethylmenaquinone methyltransferase/2-methoxy-6-polyprenyl-1,4-benzoquinol methylase